MRFDARHGSDATIAAAEELTACAGLEIAGGAESTTGALGLADTVVADAAGADSALGEADRVATDDNDDAAVVSASRDRH